MHRMHRREFIQSVLISDLVPAWSVGHGSSLALPPDPIWHGPVHMNDFQTFRLRWKPLVARAEPLWPRVRGNPRMETALASACFQLETAEVGMTNLATSDQYAYYWVDLTLRRVRDMLDAIEQGRDPFQGQTGFLIKAYRSRLDDSIQPYLLQVPETMPSGPVPLVVALHGWGAGRSIIGWSDAKLYEPWKESYIRLQVYGRGWTRYKGVGTDDVFAAIAEVRRDYGIDPNRTYLTGGSMGGAGTWFLATHFPGFFAAAAPLCGYTDYRMDYGSAHAKPEWEHRLYRAHDAFAAAVNLKRTPLYFCHGDQDLPGAYGGGVSVEHSRVMDKRLKELHISSKYDELPGVGHGIPRQQYRKSEQWLLDFKRDPNPAEVVFQTSTLRFNRAYWVEIEGLEAHFRESLIEARLDGSRLTVTASGITHFAIQKSVSLIFAINGQRVEASPGADGRIHLALQDGKWTQAPGPPTGLRKRHGLQGPWIDAFVEPAVYVVPASKSKYRELSEYDLETLQRSHGGLDCSNIRGKAEIAIPIRTDHEITGADISGRNLILFGDPDCNAVLARIQDRLPIQCSREAIRTAGRQFPGAGIGAKFIYPNPLNPARYVAVSTGTHPEALYSLRIFHWQLPDLLIFGPEAMRVGEIPYHDEKPEHTKLLEGAYLAAGFFSETWQLEI